MTDHDTSYPPSLWSATGATAGIPGTWTPAGNAVPRNLAELQAGIPCPVVASPTTAWTTGQFVQTKESGAPGRATWTGTAWVGGTAPLEETEEEEETDMTDIPDEPTPDEESDETETDETAE